MVRNRRNHNRRWLRLPRKRVFDPHEGYARPRYNWRRFPVPRNNDDIYILKGCLRCDGGDLGWETKGAGPRLSDGCYVCIQCGWREYERPRRKRETVD